MDGEDEMIKQRVDQLEQDNRTIKDKMGTVDKVMLDIAGSMGSMAATQTIMSETLSKVSENIEKFSKFEIQTGMQCKIEKEHRERIEEEIKLGERNLQDYKVSNQVKIDKIHGRIRKTNEKITGNYSELDKRFSVKKGEDNVRQSYVEQILDVGSKRFWQVAFWVVTFLVLVVGKIDP